MANCKFLEPNGDCALHSLVKLPYDKIEISNRKVTLNGNEIHYLKEISIKATKNTCMEVTLMLDADVDMELVDESPCKNETEDIVIFNHGKGKNIKPECREQLIAVFKEIFEEE